MALLEVILTIWGTAIGTASALKDLRDYLDGRVSLEDVLTELVDGYFQFHIARLKHLCPDGDPQFVSEVFKEELSSVELNIHTRDELAPALLPLLDGAVNTPGATCPPSEFTPIYRTILDAAIRDMWKRISEYDQVANEILLVQNEEQLDRVSTLNTNVQEGFERITGDISGVDTKIDGLSEQLRSLTSFALGTWQQSFDRLTHTAPPAKHRIEDQVYINPFLLRRAEDFNHNYGLLARLFHSSPEWDSIQRKADNVFIEAGRGTGKSMLLRRLTAQATVAAKRIEDPKATLEDAGQGYFGVYVKLTRGYYEQFLSVDLVPEQAGSLIAQHEVNVEIYDAFVDTINWLVKERALIIPSRDLDALVEDLNALFPKAPR
ncbi:MAG TPA: hypothetical protein VGV59_01360, partial [Pyrinomonadaceae bacterium]|nr:hypothetical protein [Pyrinomonadaceae bacterium]